MTIRYHKGEWLKECAECEGVGEWWSCSHNAAAGIGAHAITYADGSCDLCDGTGLVEAVADDFRDTPVSYKGRNWLATYYDDDVALRDPDSDDEVYGLSIDDLLAPLPEMECAA